MSRAGRDKKNVDPGIGLGRDVKMEMSQAVKQLENQKLLARMTRIDIPNRLC